MSEEKNKNKDENIVVLEDYKNKKIEEAKAVEKGQLPVMTQLLSNMGAISNAIPGMEEIAGIMALPDEHFKVLNVIFINEMEKSLKDPSTKILMAQMLREMGVTAEEILTIYGEVLAQIDEQLIDTFSQDRIDFLKRIMALSCNVFTEANGETNKTLKVPFELCHEDAKMPQYGALGDAGMDIFAIEDCTINPGETQLIRTGIKVAIPKGYEIQVRPKSGRALKTKLRVANTPGTIDSGYRDEIKVIIENVAPPIREIDYEFDENGKIVINSILHGAPYEINKGEKFAQLVLSEITTASLYEVKDIGDIEGNRGGGFGSTGLK